MDPFAILKVCAATAGVILSVDGIVVLGLTVALIIGWLWTEPGM